MKTYFIQKPKGKLENVSSTFSSFIFSSFFPGTRIKWVKIVVTHLKSLHLAYLVILEQFGHAQNS